MGWGRGGGRGGQRGPSPTLHKRGSGTVVPPPVSPFRRPCPSAQVPCQRLQQLRSRSGVAEELAAQGMVLDCDGECARQYRLHGLAEALQIAGERTRTQAERQVFENRARSAAEDAIAPAAAPSAEDAERREEAERMERRRQQDAAFRRFVDMMMRVCRRGCKGPCPPLAHACAPAQAHPL